MSENEVQFLHYSQLEMPANAVLSVWRSSRDFSKLIDRRLDLILAESKLTARTFEFLHWTDRLDLEDRSIDNVRRHSGFSASESTRLIKSLRNAGYLRTNPRVDDHRFLQLEVTALGRKIVRRSFRAVMEDLARFKKFERLGDQICERIKRFEKEIDAFDRRGSVVGAHVKDASIK